MKRTAGTRDISRRKFLSLLAGLTAAAVNGRGSSSDGESLDRSQIEAADHIVRRLVATNAVPGVSYSIGNSRRILTTGAFGLRVISPHAPMTVQTRSALGSLSKQFVSAAVFLLQQRGLLSVSAPLSDYVPEYIYAREMTLYQALTMRSGIPAQTEDCEAPIEANIDDSTLIINLNQHALDFRPGRYFAYSNCAYDVAGLAIKRVSGMNFGQFVAKNFFGPLGMRSSGQLGSIKDDDFAQGYAPNGSRWETESFSRADAAFASGNLVSTSVDVQAWNRSLLNATLLSRDTLRQMFALPDAPDTKTSHYAGGWVIEPSGIIWHGGVLSGYGAVNMLFPMTGHAITILTNAAPERWDSGGTALAIYNAARLGPRLPLLLPAVHSTVPKSG